VITELSHILLDNIPLGDIISVTHSRKLLTTDDVNIIWYYYDNEYSRKQFLLSHLQYLKLHDWVAIGNSLQKMTTMKNTGDQLISGKLHIYIHYYVNTKLST